MKQTVVKATVGRKQGSRSSRRLRAEGQLPGVVYGLGKDPRVVAVGYNDLRDALKGAGGMNTVLSLDVEGDSEMVLVRSLDRDPLKRVVIHADFLRVDPDQRVTVSVPIEIVGEPLIVLEAGGIIEQQRFELEVEVSPINIPDVIEVDVTDLEMESRISIGDLSLPAGVTTAVPEEISLITTSYPRVEAVVEAEEGEGLEGEGVEGEEGDAEGGDAEASDDADGE